MNDARKQMNAERLGILIKTIIDKYGDAEISQNDFDTLIESLPNDLIDLVVRIKETEKIYIFNKLGKERIDFNKDHGEVYIEFDKSYKVSVVKEELKENNSITFKWEEK